MASVKLKDRYRGLLIAGGAPTQEELEARQKEIVDRLRAIDDENAGQGFSDEIRAEWNQLNEEREANARLIDELAARRARLAELAQEEPVREAGAAFYTPGGNAARGADIWDLTTLRSLPSQEAASRELSQRVQRAVDTADYPTSLDDARAKEHISKLAARFSADEESSQDFARRIMQTGNPVYKRAFGKTLAGRALTPDEQRALALGGTANYPVPFSVDPTVIPTSASSVNPFRQIARVETITGNTWRGVTSAGVSAAYGAESTEASDNAPTLVQPELNVEKAQAFVPYTIEAGEDWSGLQAEIGRMLADAKDDLEATKFAVGAGHGSNEPQGVITGATTTVDTATAATFVVADLYSVTAALPARFRSRASIVAERSVYTRIRQFDTYGGSNMWMQLAQGAEGAAPNQGSIGAQILGFPAYESSAMASTIASGDKILVIGDFRYYLIVDRVGMNVELIPHLFATANNRPSGQRGLYAYWRNTAEVLAAGAFRVLVSKT